MAYEQKPGEFALFPNDKRGNPKAPDMTGKGIDLDGNEVSVSAWEKQGRNGIFLSCRFGPPYQKSNGPKEARQPPKHASKPAADFDDDIPF